MFDTLTLQKQLVAAAMPSGFESGVGALLAELAAPYADEVMTDALGNVICHKKGEGKRLMFAAHMDVIGFIATFVNDGGFVSFTNIGGHMPAGLINTPVRFVNGVRGIIKLRAQADKLSSPVNSITVKDLYIDIGANSYERAASVVSIGDVCVFDGETYSQNGMVLTPYADDLVACTVLLRVMEQLKQSPYDLYFVFTVQEEVGLRGAGTSAHRIAPEMGIAVDVCGTGDVPSSTAYFDVKLGRGATVKIKDGSLLCNPQVISFLRDAAERAGVTYQDEVMLSGGTDAGAIQRTLGGILAGGVSIPTRNIHSPREIYSLSDVDGAVSILTEALSR